MSEAHKSGLFSANISLDPESNALEGLKAKLPGTLDDKSCTKCDS